MMESDTPIRLKKNGAWIILFYGEDEVSKLALQTWAKVAQTTIGPDFGSCNLRLESNLASKILETYNTNPSMRWTNNLRVPYILAYSGTWPISKYTGNVDEQSISNWALTTVVGGYQDCTAKVTTTQTNQTEQIKQTEISIPKTL